MPFWLRGFVAVGAGVSIVLIGVMFREDYLCGYCLAIHALNIAFAISYELSRRPTATDELATPERANPFVSFSATFVATSLLLAVVEHQSTAAAAQHTKSQLKQALDQGTQDERVANTGGVFSPGRYHLGSTTVKVHVVVVSDYQCPSCRTIDAQLRAMAAGREDISISARHFPFCTDCNEHVDKTRHPNACRAALAAEAAGIVGGADAFWRMHDWLFERRGDFTDDELRAQAVEIGLDVHTFLAAFDSEKTLAVVRQDATEADAAGLRFTPMVFINGKPVDLGVNQPAHGVMPRGDNSH
jgi:protein-disulfide isomerase